MSWKQAFKEMPAYIADGCRGVYNYWRNAPPREWVAEFGWLTILVAIFYYGINGIMAGMEWASANDVNPNGPIGILLTFAPLVLVAIIFFANYTYSYIVSSIFKWMGHGS